MCLPVSRLFWVSSLAYPNLLGTKGYVVVVVVIVVVVVVVVWISEMYVITLWRGWDDDTAVWFNSVRYGVPRNQIRNRSWLIPPIRKLYRITQQSPLSVSITFFLQPTDHGNQRSHCCSPRDLFSLPFTFPSMETNAF
jgi:hypothetical protein